MSLQRLREILQGSLHLRAFPLQTDAPPSPPRRPSHRLPPSRLRPGGRIPGRRLHPSPRPPDAPPDRDALIQALFECESPDALDTAVSAARQGGVPEQTILEARFLFLVDQEDYPAIAALAPEFVQRRSRFQLDDSAIFAVPEDWQAVVEYSLALAALQKNDQDEFKKHITEAFWFSPRQAAAFAPHIERLRLTEAMAKVRIDFARPLFTQETREKSSLGNLAGDSHHVLLHFWSPWSQECEAYLPDFLATANLLHQNGITVVSVLAEIAPEVLPDAEAFRSAAAPKSPAVWILDDQNNPLGRALRVQNLPTAVLLNREGAVLFNGHPAEDSFWNELKNVAPAITRPDLPPASFETPPDPAK